MSRIFVSHASADNREARALKQWLSEQRPQLANEIFLDIDPRTGLKLGDRWKSQLFKNNAQCELVVCLLSRQWEKSHECKTEYRTAEGLGKRILCVRLDNSTDTDIDAEWPRFDIFAPGRSIEVVLGDGQSPVSFNTAALVEIRRAVEGIGIGPGNFVWPPAEDPDRVPYRGWEPFEDIDAGVFFGRDAAIVRGLDELRSLRRSGPESLFVVLGPSGSGKSSYLRAGLMPRLQREDRRFFVLGVMRPELRAMTGARGFLELVATVRSRLSMSPDTLDPARAVDSLTEIREIAALRTGVEPGESAPTMVLAIDQAEELFSADAAETHEFLVLVAELSRRLNTEDIGLIVLATIRTDRYEAMQSRVELEGITTRLFTDLKPMPATEFEQVITGPAARDDTGPRLAPELVERLIADAGEGADTLPLLSLTLARLYADWKGAPPDKRPDELGVLSYEATGGLRDIVDNEIEQILDAEPGERQSQLSVLRSAFVPWLATINPDSDQPMRRVARYRDLPAGSRPLIDSLVAHRLMVSDERNGEQVIEVALESLLRQWDPLVGWLREQRQDLITAEDVQRSARAWANHDRDPAWLLTGTRLTDSEALYSADEFASLLAGTADYLAASRQLQDSVVEAAEERRRAELTHALESQMAAESYATVLSGRSRVLRRVLTATAVVAAVAVLGALVAAVGSGQAHSARMQAQDRFIEATVLRLQSEATDILTGTAPGGDIRAFTQMIAAQRLSKAPDLRPLLYAAATRANTVMVADLGAEVYDVATTDRAIAVACADGVRLLDVGTGRPVVPPLTGHTGSVYAVAISPDGRRLASAGQDHDIRLWDAHTGELIGNPLTGHTALVNSLAFSPSGHRLISGAGDETLRLWDVDAGKQIGRAWTGHTGWVEAVAFSPDGRTVASGSADDTVQFWDADTGLPTGAPLSGYGDDVTSVAFSPDGRMLVSGGGTDDPTVRLWDVATHRQVGMPLENHGSYINRVVFSPDGKRVASASDDGTVMLWDPVTGFFLTQLTGHNGFVNGVAFAPDGHRLISAGEDHTVRVWNADEPLLLPDAVMDVAFSPDSSRLVTAGADDLIRMWDAATGRPAGRPLAGHSDEVVGVAFSPDGHRLATASRDRTVRFWSAETGRPVDPIVIRQDDKVTAVAFSPDGRKLATGGWDGSVRLWDTISGAPIGDAITAHTDKVTAVAFSPDGRRLASVSWDRTLRLWDPATGRPADVPRNWFTVALTSVVFSPDGTRLATGGTDGSVLMWDAEHADLLGQPLIGHHDAVTSVAYSPDGRMLASGSADTTVRLWDGNTGTPVMQPLYGHFDAVLSLAFSPDGRTLASAGDDATVRLWPLSDSPEALCDKLSTNIGADDWNRWVSPDIPYERHLCPGLPASTTPH